MMLEVFEPWLNLIHLIGLAGFLIVGVKIAFAVEDVFLSIFCAGILGIIASSFSVIVLHNTSLVNSWLGAISLGLVAGWVVKHGLSKLFYWLISFL